MPWSNKTQIMTDVSVAGSEQFSSAVTLNPGETAHVEVEADFPALPTDELVVAVYGTLDATSENWDDTAILKFNISKTPDPNKVSFVVSGVYRFRLGCVRSGSTDTI
jgi:hypothetical protein